jgi:hypothetical protein
MVTKKVYTATNRNNKLENKISGITYKSGNPPGYAIGYGSKVKGGKETAIVVKIPVTTDSSPSGKSKSIATTEARKIKGKVKDTKSNIVKAIAKLEKKPYKALTYKPKTKPKSPVIPVKNGRGGSGLVGGRGFGGGLMNNQNK